MTNREECREFRKIPSLKFLYEVSEDGRIFRNIKSKKQLKISKNKDAYRVVSVTIKQNRKRIYIHRVVAECWLGTKPDGLETDHIDRNKDNNHYTNLRYVTKSEQMKNRDHSKINVVSSANLVVARATLCHPVLLNGQHFESMRAAARFVAEQSNKTVNSIMAKFKKRRKFILGYDVKYLHS
ncbi:MAG: HNH endonuclease [Selenomonadaceae bacterium]|nr:HNH endonuclease [Selenomonadaceae bacterium]